MYVHRFLKLGMAALAATACFSAQAGSNGVIASITPERDSLGASDDVVVNVTITNTSSTPQHVLSWYTPFGETQESLFDVTRDGVKVNYRGAHYKRHVPRPGNYITLEPGESRSAKVELSVLYDMSVTGDYQVRYHTASLNLFNSAVGHGQQALYTASADAVSTEKEIGEIESDPARIWIDGVLQRGAAPAPRLLDTLRADATAGLSTANCSSSQASQVTSAFNAAKTMLANSNSYLGAGTSGTRYTKWFGSYTSSRYSTIKTHYTALKDAFANKPVLVDCGCKGSEYAHVYPDQPYHIYVCKAFWPAPITGTDSKGGTLIHEMSHFYAVASTDDWAYGQSAAASLAISNPTKAIDNADSHEYFGENTPALP